MRARTKIWLALAAVLIAISHARAETAPANAEEQVRSGIIPRYLLMNDRGQAVTDQDFPGRFQLISFGYTFCPDVCPTTLAEMSLILDKLGKKSRRMQALFVTLDPERDTPEVLRNYTAYFNSRIMGLSGPPELVRRVADNFRVRYEKHWEPGAAKDKYSVDHSAGMYLLGPDGRFLVKFAYATPPEQIAQRILHLMDAPLAAPDGPEN
jgi:protein SCO1